ncbi:MULTISPECIES: sulfite exporter TauE/SafE family protein [Aquimarina]|uniref:Sulfite exporter TauE/SafE family protein n=1 Tax=Aquimarina algiphila TaxID=2047982 RepID=A0A554VGM2_9FLAO|nr:MULTISPECIES: sulfite exporter TauE/SafE family protein [Aquimarina]TSE06540.1 sulfite exporter TauE/SafE family protein [Aquimarina algiphila]
MLLSAFILGLLGSFHCVGMCGPIAFMLPVHQSNTFQKIFRVFLYHFGRLIAYCIIGLFFGIIGKSLNIFGLQQNLSIAVGVLMIILILIPHQTLNKYNISKPIYKVITKVKNALGIALKKKTPDTFLSIGFLNGFLPCGLVYMAVFGAIASGQIFEGSLYMVFFGLGTIPLMTVAVYAGNFLTRKVRQHIQKAIPVFVVIIGLLFIIRGLGLGIPYLSPKPAVEMVSADFECH